MTKFTPDNICDIKNQDVGRSLSSKAQTHPDTIMISFQRHFNECQWPLEYLYKKENSETAIPFPYFTRLAHLSGREVKTSSSPTRDTTVCLLTALETFTLGHHYVSGWAWTCDPQITRKASWPLAQRGALISWNPGMVLPLQQSSTRTR